MQVIDAFNYVASQVDDLLFGYFTKPQLLIYLNQAVQECQKKLIAAGNNWYLIKTEDSGPTATYTVANQAEYSPPADTMNINRLEVVQNPGINETRNALYSITLNQKDFMNGYTYFPVAFYLTKDKIVMCPTPQIGGLLIRYYYTYRIDQLVNDSDVIDVPDEFYEYVCALVILKCFAKDTRDPGIFADIVRTTEQRLEKQAIQRAQDHAPTIVLTGEGYGWGGFY